MQMTITAPEIVTEVKAEFSPRMILAAFFGYLVMGSSVPEWIQKAMDDTPRTDFPQEWEMVISMWRNRNVEMDVKEIYEIITPWLKEAL